MTVITARHGGWDIRTGKFIRDEPIIEKDIGEVKYEVWKVDIFFGDESEWSIERNGKEVFHSKIWEEIKQHFDEIQ